LSDPADNPFNGSFKVTAVMGSPSTQFQYTMVSTPSAAPTGDMWVGRFSSHLVSITGLAATQVPMTNDWEVVITTAAPHFRVPGGNVAVQEVYVGQFPNQTKSTLYNGSFKVEEMTPWDPKKLKSRSRLSALRELGILQDSLACSFKRFPLTAEPGKSLKETACSTARSAGRTTTPGTRKI